MTDQEKEWKKYHVTTYTVPQHEGIYTFVDCPYRKQIKDYDDGGMLSECHAKGGNVSCEYNLHYQVRICPEGYVQ